MVQLTVVNVSMIVGSVVFVYDTI